LNKKIQLYFIGLLFLLLATFIGRLEEELSIIVFGSIVVLVFGRLKTNSFFVSLNIIYSWIASTKGLESDYLIYANEYSEATNTGYINYILNHIKSPFFYSIFYVQNWLGFTFRSTIGVLIFVLNLIYISSLNSFFSGRNLKFSIFILFIYFPIFDTSNHLIRQHTAVILVIYGLVRTSFIPMILGFFTHLSSFIFLTKFYKFIKIKKSYFTFILALLIFNYFNFIKIFIISNIIPRFSNLIELEELNLFSILVILITLIPLYDKKYRSIFFVSIASLLSIMYFLRMNSEIVFRTSKYFHYLIPFSLTTISTSISSYFRLSKLIFSQFVILISSFLIIYFYYKLFYEPNWLYFIY